MVGLMPIPFGNPATYPDHSGVDFGQKTGTWIKASGRGRVTQAGYWNAAAGYATQVQYDDGPLVLYCHQPAVAKRPAVGSITLLGSLLGEVGSTGHSTGPHLHMEIMQGRGAHTYQGIWWYFNPDWVIGQGSGAGGVTNPDDSTDEDEMNIVLYLYTPDNRLCLVDHVNKTYRDLGKDPNSIVRDYYSQKNYISVNDAQWAEIVGVGTKNPYKALTIV